MQAKTLKVLGSEGEREKLCPAGELQGGWRDRATWALLQEQEFDQRAFR